MNTFGTSRYPREVAAILPLLAVLVIAVIAEAAGNFCSASGVTGAPISCSGTCPATGSPACAPVTRNVGDQQAQFCGCPSTPGGFACCYLLQWTSGDDAGSFFTLGNCLACNMPGLKCKRVGAGTWPDPYEAGCTTP